LIINQLNRKYLTCTQKVTRILFITHTELHVKGIMEKTKRKPLLSSPESVAVGGTGIYDDYDYQSYLLVFGQ